jgi:hypothetical protein
VAETANSVIELLVGLVCIGLAMPAWARGGGLRVAGVVFGIAGAAAVAHAVIRLAQ